MTFIIKTEVTIGEILKLARQRKKMSQSAAAELSGLHRNTIHAIECDDDGITIGTYNAYCKALNYEVRIVLENKEQVNP